MTAYAIALIVCAFLACVIVWLGWYILGLKERLWQERLNREIDQRAAIAAFQEYDRLANRMREHDRKRRFLADRASNRN